MEFCNSYVLCLQAFFLFCVLLPLFTSLSETFYLAFSSCPYVYSAERSELPSESEHKFDPLKVTAADLLPESEVTSRLSVGISPRESDLRTAQTYLGYRKTGKHSKFLAHVWIKMFVKIKKVSFWTKNRAGIHSAGSVCLLPARVSQGSLWY